MCTYYLLIFRLLSIQSKQIYWLKNWSLWDLTTPSSGGFITSSLWEKFVNQHLRRGATRLHPFTLFTFYTNDSVSHKDYRDEINHFGNWCLENSLILNTKKPKEIILFNNSSFSPVIMTNTDNEIVQEYKYLATIMDDKLTWNAKTTARFVKAQQHLYVDVDVTFVLCSCCQTRGNKCFIHPFIIYEK